MADYPCDFHLARYQGPSHRAYLNLFSEEKEIRLKASVCGDCLADVVTAWLSRALVQGDNGRWDPLEDGTELDQLWRPTGSPPGALNRFPGIRGRLVS